MGSRSRRARCKFLASMQVSNDGWVLTCNLGAIVELVTRIEIAQGTRTVAIKNAVCVFFFSFLLLRFRINRHKGSLPEKVMFWGGEGIIDEGALPMIGAARFETKKSKCPPMPKPPNYGLE